MAIDLPKTLRPLAIVRDYHDLRDAVRLRVEQIKISRLELDERAGIASGASGRLLSLRATKRIGNKAIRRYLDATELVLVAIVADDETIEAIERDIAAANASDNAYAATRPPHWRLGKSRAWGRRMAGLRAVKLTPEQRSASARIAARARWSRSAAAPTPTPEAATVDGTAEPAPAAEAAATENSTAPRSRPEDAQKCPEGAL